MTLRNRVQPDGQILAVPSRGMFTGNRGLLHIADRVMGKAVWKHRAWICCALEWQGRQRPLMTGRNWTELFFLDEAVALAAGHRPCATCRRSDYNAFLAAWGQNLKAREIDRVLHAARATPSARHLKTHRADAESLPTGTFVLVTQPYLLTDDAMRPYTPAGYGPREPRPVGPVTVLTAPPMIDVLRGGYAPHLHPSAR